MLTIDRSFLSPDGEPDARLLHIVLQKHEALRGRLDRLKEIYEREHNITIRKRLKGLPNNRLVHDIPGYIVTLAAGYLVGAPVGYTADEEHKDAFQTISDAYRAASVESVDAELAVDASVYGKGVELCYADAMARPRVAQVDVRTSFVVYDNTVEHLPAFGVILLPLMDRTLNVCGKTVMVYTQSQVIKYKQTGSELPHEVAREVHYFGGVPMTEYWNNARETGDFETVMSLIDAYDGVQSDRVNDKQQFTDAILVLKGVGSLGVDDTEEVSPEADDEYDEPYLTRANQEQREREAPSVRLRQTRTLFLPADGADAKFAVKPDSENGNELLRASLKSDIHKLSLVPDLTDEEFAGNVSGVAMKFKLFGLEQLTKIKERWFREGLRNRLRLFAAFLTMKGASVVDADAVQINFSRSLPVNNLEVAQMVATYQGLVPSEMLLAQVPFIEDAEAAKEMLVKEHSEAAKLQREAFSSQSFKTDDKETDEKDE